MEALELVLGGVEPQFLQPNLPLVPRGAPNQAQMAAALKVMQGDVMIGAASKLPVTELCNTRHLVPWFVIEKSGPDTVKKFRLISDCTKLKYVLHPPKFRLENWKDILIGGEVIHRKFIFFLKKPHFLARSFAYLSANEAQGLLASGSQWTRAGWTTNRASKTLFHLTQITLMASAVMSYRDAWLVAFTNSVQRGYPGLGLDRQVD